MSFDWPSAEQWQTMSAVATCVAVIIALAGLLVELRMRRRDKADSAASQARLIFEDPQATFGSMYLDLHITNHSSEPVHAIEIEDVWCRTDGHTAHDWAASFMIEGARTWANSLPPGQSVNFTVSFKDAGGMLNGAPKPNADLEYGLTFTFLDAHGLRWRRRGFETPVRVVD